MAMVAQPAPAETITYDPHFDFMLNPGIGFMRLLTLNHTNSSRNAVLAEIDNLRATEHSIAWIVFDLNRDRNTDTLGADLKSNIAAVFARARLRGVKVIPRIRYHTQASFTPSEPDIARQSLHLDQLATTFNQYHSIVVCYQAGGFGAYGEWYYTANTTGAVRRQLLDKMFDILPSDALIQVRTPYYKREYIASGAMPDRLARVGHYNDCFLTGPTDYGTYSCYPFTGSCPSVASLRNEVRLDSNIVPVGGETCPLEGDQAATYNDCTAPYDAMATLGWSFINTAYYTPNIDEWKTQGCWPDIRRRLGYRYEIVSATVPDQVSAGTPFTVSFTVRNQGFAPTYHERPVYVALLDESNQLLASYLVADADPRDWRPLAGNYSYSMTQTAPSSITPSTIRIALWMPDKDVTLSDRSEYAIRCASHRPGGADVWTANGLNVLKTGIPVVAVPVSNRVIVW